jgi:hypothetical protein
MNNIGRRSSLDRTAPPSRDSRVSGPNGAPVKTPSEVWGAQNQTDRETAVVVEKTYRIPNLPARVELDDLFKRTGTDPALYYLPVSREEVEKRRLARRG